MIQIGGRKRIINLLEADMNKDINENAHDKTNIMGVGVTSTSTSSVIKIIDEQVKTGSKPFFIITAYSETFLEDKDKFKKALAEANMVVADGVSVCAAIDYLRGATAIKVALNILQNKYANRPSGIKIFKNILESGKYRIYLTGGFNNVAERLADKYKNVVGWDNGDKNTKKINAAKADILFVSLGRFKQEVWIHENLDKLNVKIVIGVGSAFDEVAENWPVPKWINDMGLKWLWRITRDPRHISRALNAFPVFPLKVWWWKTTLS